MYQDRADPLSNASKVTYAHCIDSKSLHRLIFAIIHPVKCGCVDNTVGTYPIYGGLNGGSIADFKLLMGNCNYLILGQGSANVLCQLAVCTNEQNPHFRSLPENL